MQKRTIFRMTVVISILMIALTGCTPTSQAPSAPAATGQAPSAPVATSQAPSEAPAPAKGPIIVGVPTLLTGVGAPMGEDIKAGAELAAAKINSEGGILGRQIELVYADTKGTSAEDCALAAQVLDGKNVAAYMAGAFYGPACIDEFGKREAPLLHNSAGSDMVAVVVKQGYDNIFQMCASEYTYGPNAYKVITEATGYKFPNKKVAILGGDTSYDMTIQKYTSEVFKQNGWEVVLDDTYPYGNTEFGSQLAKIRAENPAVIMGIITTTDSSVAFMNQFLQNPTNSLVYIQWSPASPEFINLLKDKANGVLWQTLIQGLPNSATDEYNAGFKKTFGRDPGAWPPMVYDHFYMWKTAVETCGSETDFKCVNEYLTKLSEHPYKGLCGTYGFDQVKKEGLTGDEWIPMHFVQIQDKKNVTIFLGTKPEAGNTFQTPPWIK